jgi:hypothetical protein
VIRASRPAATRAGLVAASPCLRVPLVPARPRPRRGLRAIAGLLLDAGVDRSPTSLMRDVESVGLLLEAGAAPHRYRDDDREPVPIVRAAVRAGCSIELLELLLAHHAEPNSVGPDGHAPYQNVLKTPARHQHRRQRSRDERPGDPDHGSWRCPLRPALVDVRDAMHRDRGRSPGVEAQCGMISTSIGKYCGAPPSGGGPPMTSPSAGPSFSSMKRSKASRDSQTSYT